jgi:carboxymethylenebutenolidase
MASNQKTASDIIGLMKSAWISRRGFMSTSAAAAAGYTLAAGSVRADAIQTDNVGIETGPINIAVADGEMPAFFARPAGIKNPPIILVAMEIFGLHEYIKDVARMPVEDPATQH